LATSAVVAFLNAIAAGIDASQTLVDHVAYPFTVLGTIDHAFVGRSADQRRVTPIVHDVVPTAAVRPTSASRKRSILKTDMLLFQAIEAIATIAILVAVKRAIAVLFEALQLFVDISTEVVSAVGTVDHANVIGVDLRVVLAIHIESVLADIRIAFIV